MVNNSFRRRGIGPEGLILLLALVALLQIISSISGASTLLAVVVDLVRLFRANLWLHLAISLLRVVVSLLIAGTLGTLLGYLAYQSKIADVLLNSAVFPILESLPPLTWTIVCVLVYGISQFNVIFIVSIILIQYFVVNMLAGMSSVDPELVEMGQSFASDSKKVLRYVQAPMIAQFIFPSIRIAYGVGWKVIVLAEMFGATDGIGFLINQAYSVLNLTRVLSLSVLVVVVFWPTERILALAADRVFRSWQHLGQHQRQLADLTLKVSHENKPIRRPDRDEIMQVEGLSKTFDDRPVLVDITFSLHMNEIVCILGPTGCGKTTLLRIAAGLLEPDPRRVSISRTVSGNLESTNGPMGFVFQEPRLLPWRTVRENIELPFLLRGQSVDRPRVNELIRILELEDWADGAIAKLSGGMQQRVSIARAMALDPDILILDEPFKGLDILSRERAEDKVLELYHETGKAVLFVTHDIDESIRIADRILVLSKRPASVNEDFDLQGTETKPRDPYSEKLFPIKRRIWECLHNSDRHEGEIVAVELDIGEARLDSQPRNASTEG